MSFRKCARFVAGLLMLGAVARAGAEEITGKVVDVIDGDSLVVADKENRRYEVWLQGIDAPDPGMPYGDEAKQALSDLTLNRTVRVKVARRDDNGTIEGAVFLGRQNVGERMLADGWAWRFYRYANRSSFSRAENNARAARKGLWADEEPTPPWEYRKQKERGDFAASAAVLAKEARLVDNIPPELTLDVQMNRSRLFRAKRTINRVSITATDIANVVQFSPTEFEVSPVSPGETTLTVWFVDASGAETLLRYLVRVNPAE